jgi:hypothetical protein
MTSAQSFKIARILKETFQVSEANRPRRRCRASRPSSTSGSTSAAGQLATKSDLAEVKFDILKWVIITLAAQTGTILGFLYFLLRKY